MDPADSGRWQMVRGVLEAHGYEEPIFIGEGSFAKVYRVKDKEGCFWACRVSEYSGQWERECRNWQEIRHPLFPVYREHWTQDGMGYLIIEFWDGMDLRKMLDRRGRLSPVTALNVTLQITEGLQYLHEREHPFLYRDLKPENIRIRENGRAGILDLGCLWNREDAWSGAGNYSYSAPEQFARGELPGEESDVYAVGRLLSVMLGEEKVHLKISGKDRRREKWLRRIVEMTTCEERKRRVPDIKHLRRLLLVTDAGVRERRWAAKAADFYYVRKLHYP